MSPHQSPEDQPSVHPALHTNPIFDHNWVSLTHSPPTRRPSADGFAFTAIRNFIPSPSPSTRRHPHLPNYLSHAQLTRHLTLKWYPSKTSPSNGALWLLSYLIRLLPSPNSSYTPNLQIRSGTYLTTPPEAYLDTESHPTSSQKAPPLIRGPAALSFPSPFPFFHTSAYYTSNSWSEKALNP